MVHDIDDPLMLWAAEQPGARFWIRPGAMAVACADLCRGDRVAIHGDPAAVAALLRDEVLPDVGPSYRPVGGEQLIADVVGLSPQLKVAGRFAWMDVAGAVDRKQAGRWLFDDELPGVTALLDEFFPKSYARPGGNGVYRWAGLHDYDGTLLAAAADAWTTPAVGFLAGVITHPAVRGRGVAQAICAYVTNELAAGRNRVALLADYDNVAAISAYRKLGFDLRPVAAARVS
ncbi:GNAT family N-acetyltransferase [Actinoplanes sp. NPDC026619]|uniref:GNAT family N-acetyltransferase n=1 Tax=Actinoplanes sp. NPDC026619 TaxID=3155798 RepID=UPI0033C9ABE5